MTRNFQGLIIKTLIQTLYFPNNREKRQDKEEQETQHILLL